MDCLFTSELPLPFCNMCEGDCGDCGECGDCCDCQCHGMCNGGGINERSLKIFCYTALVVVYLLVVFIGMLYVAKTECAATPAPSLFPPSSAQNSDSLWFKWYMDMLCDESTWIHAMLLAFIVAVIMLLVFIFLMWFMFLIVKEVCTTSSSGGKPRTRKPRTRKPRTMKPRTRKNVLLLHRHRWRWR